MNIFTGSSSIGVFNLFNNKNNKIIKLKGATAKGLLTNENGTKLSNTILGLIRNNKPIDNIVMHFGEVDINFSYYYKICGQDVIRQDSITNNTTDIKNTDDNMKINNNVKINNRTISKCKSKIVNASKSTKKSTKKSIELKPKLDSEIMDYKVFLDDIYSRYIQYVQHIKEISKCKHLILNGVYPNPCPEDQYKIQLAVYIVCFEKNLYLVPPKYLTLKFHENMRKYWNDKLKQFCDNNKSSGYIYYDLDNYMLNNKGLLLNKYKDISSANIHLRWEPMVEHHKQVLNKYIKLTYDKKEIAKGNKEYLIKKMKDYNEKILNPPINNAVKNTTSSIANKTSKINKKIIKKSIKKND